MPCSWPGDVGVVAGEPDLALRISIMAYILATWSVQRCSACARRLGAGVAVRPHVLEQVGAPVDAGLDAARIVGRGRAALRAGRHQHVGEAVDLHAEVGRDRAVAPTCRRSFSPPTPRMSMRSKAPVMASKPVA